MFVLVGKVKTKKVSAKISKKIDTVLSKMNNIYKQDLIDSFKRVDAISFEAVLAKAIYVFEMIDKIKFECDDYQLDFAVGFCDNTSTNQQINIENGKINAFHALQRLEEKNDYGNAHIHVSLGKQNSLENLVNASLRTTDFIESRWRKSQYDLVKYLILNYGFMEKFVQKDVADTLQLSPQNFNQQLKNSGYFNILKLKRELTVVLEQYRRAIYHNN